MSLAEARERVEQLKREKEERGRALGSTERQGDRAKLWTAQAEFYREVAAIVAEYEEEAGLSGVDLVWPVVFYPVFEALALTFAEAEQAGVERRDRVTGALTALEAEPRTAYLLDEVASGHVGARTVVRSHAELMDTVRCMAAHGKLGVG
jgi:hypothetical protein